MATGATADTRAASVPAAGGAIPDEVLLAVLPLGRGPASTVQRLRGGSTKGVYRIRWADGKTVLVYRWHPDEDRWPPGRRHWAGGPSSGCARFLTAHHVLHQLGVRVPAIHGRPLVDTEVAAKMVVVEDLGSRTLADVLARGGGRGERVLAELKATLRTVHARQRRAAGPLEAAGRRPAVPFPELVLSRARRDLRDAGTHPRLRPLVPELEARLIAASARVEPRAGACLVHGELGPDHVLVPSDGRPVLIDLEGLHYADIEWEHAYLALRFGPHYGSLRRTGLDAARLEFYTLAHHLSLVAGPLHLLSSGRPDRGMQRIADHHAARLVHLTRRTA
jgi:aminoglycoside phosphotransferase (APT) family kinase protein